MEYARCILAAALVALVASSAVAATNGDPAPQQSFSVATLHGGYASHFGGEIYIGKAWVPILGTGVFIADGSGHLSGRETYVIGTKVCAATITGTYAVASDGTGSDAITYRGGPGCQGGSYTQSLVIGHRGEQVLLVNTNAGNRIEEEWHSQR